MPSGADDSILSVDSHNMLDGHVITTYTSLMIHNSIISQILYNITKIYHNGNIKTLVTICKVLTKTGQGVPAQKAYKQGKFQKQHKRLVSLENSRCSTKDLRTWKIPDAVQKTCALGKFQMQHNRLVSLQSSRLTRIPPR